MSMHAENGNVPSGGGDGGAMRIGDILTLPHGDDRLLGDPSCLGRIQQLLLTDRSGAFEDGEEDEADQLIRSRVHAVLFREDEWKKYQVQLQMLDAKFLQLTGAMRGEVDALLMVAELLDQYGLSNEAEVLRTVAGGKDQL